MNICKFIVKIAFFAYLMSVPAIAKNSPDLCLKKDLLTAENTLRCFLSLDASGRRLKSDSEKMSPMDLTSWEAEPGWDTFTVIDRYEIAPTLCGESQQSRACFNVNYFEWVTLSSNFKLEKIPRKAILQTLNFEVTQINKEWKITSPDPFNPHVSVDAALKHFESLANSLSKADKKATYNAHDKVWKIIHKLESLK